MTHPYSFIPTDITKANEFMINLTAHMHVIFMYALTDSPSVLMHPCVSLCLIALHMCVSIVDEKCFPVCICLFMCLHVCKYVGMTYSCVCIHSLHLYIDLYEVVWTCLSSCVRACLCNWCNRNTVSYCLFASFVTITDWSRRTLCSQLISLWLPTLNRHSHVLTGKMTR